MSVTGGGRRQLINGLSGSVVPQLVEAWHVPPVAFTPALAAGNIGMFFALPTL